MIQENVADTTEEWRAVPNYEDRYEVSNIGRVRSLLDFTGKKRIKIKSTRLVNKRYRRVTLYKHGEQWTITVHQLVALCFIGPPPKGMTVNHIDTIKLNNHLSNLEYITQRDNTAHSVKNRLHAYGARNGRCKLKEEDIPRIRWLIKSGVPTLRITEEFGVSDSVILNIAKGKLWKHIPLQREAMDGGYRPPETQAESKDNRKRSLRLRGGQGTSAWRK